MTLDVEARVAEVEHHPLLGVVHWNARANAWEAFPRLFGQVARTPVLITPPRGKRTAEQRAALFELAHGRLGKLGTTGEPSRSAARAAWQGRLKKEQHVGEPRVALHCVQLLEQQVILSWGLEGEPARPPVSFWCDDNGKVKDKVDMALPVLNHPPEWLLALPVVVTHPALGSGTLVLPTPQYLFIRPDLEPRLVRIDLDAAFAAGLTENLDKVAARLATMGMALERTRAAVRSAFKALFRAKAAGPVAAWAIFLVEGNSAYLFENQGDAENFKDLSARFDQRGVLTTVVLTTPRETTEHPVG